MLPFARRLRLLGLEVSIFSRHYPATGAAAAAVDLRQHLQSIKFRELHLVAHSFGGIVVLNLFDQLGATTAEATGIQSTTFIASPLAGAQLASKLVNGRAGFFWRRMLGRSLETGLLEGVAAMEIPANSAFITGEKKSLASRLLQRDIEIGDGLVRFTETLAAEQPATRHVSVPLTHAGLLYSNQCSNLVHQFVSEGSFQADW